VRIYSRRLFGLAGPGASGHLVLLPRILSPSNINQNALMLKRYQIGLVSDRQVIWRVTLDFVVHFAFKNEKCTQKQIKVARYV
jgi:hypothetical protein